jgi:integrating conjugative element protein (TIGR03755 family)
MHMTNRRVLFLVPILLCALPCMAQEQTRPRGLPVGKADWYYSLGGSTPVLNFSEGADVTKFNLFNGNAKWHLDACAFDFKKMVNAHLNDPRRNLYALEKNIIDSARSLIRISALGVIQRANPGLYDLMTRGLANAQLGFDVAVKNCEQIRADVASSKNPLYGWLRLAAHARWTAPGRQDDPDKIDESNKRNPGADGVPWVNGRHAGGKGQKKISITADVVGAGYRSWYGVNPQTHTTPWSRAEQAIGWAQEVLGETELSFCKDCKGISTRPGKGLQMELARGQKHYRKLLSKLVLSKKRPEAGDIAALSSNGMGVGINMHVIQALKNEAPVNRDILINRLANEVTLSDAMEKALITRQLLYAGAAEPNIAANSEALAMVADLQSRLRSEMDNVLFEHRVRREVLTGTAQSLLARANVLPELPPSPKRLNIRSGLRPKEDSKP